MALSITKNQEIYELVGNIKGKNALSLKKHFEEIIRSTEKVVLSLDKVKEIDKHGIQVLNNLCRDAMKKNKVFCVLRSGNNAINQAFGDVNYILRNDFV